VTDLSVLAHIAVLLVRPGMVVALAPTFGGTFVPAISKVGLTALLAVGLLPSVVVPPFVGEVALVGVLAREVAIGLALGLTLRALIGGIEFAGHLSGQQMGLSYAATIDPNNGVRNTTVTSLFGMIAVLTLFGTNGHHAILRAMASSYAGLPIEIAIGFVSRVAPTLTFMVIGYPLRMIVGLFVLGLLVGTVPGVVSGLTESTIRLALDSAGAFR